MNPIHKGDSNVRAARPVHRIKCWVYTCPECEAQPKPGYYNGYKGFTRKQAKDALHKHMIKEHGMPR